MEISGGNKPRRVSCGMFRVLEKRIVESLVKNLMKNPIKSPMKSPDERPAKSGEHGI